MELKNDTLIDDWNSVIENTLSKTYFINKYWERFIGLYISVFRQRDDANLIFVLNEIIDKMLKMNIIPIFENPNQFSQYLKVSFLHKYKLQKIKDYEEKSNLYEMKEELIEFIPDLNSSNVLKMDILLTDLESILTPHQLEIVILLLKGYSRKYIGNLLGISLSAVNNRIYCVQEKIKNYIYL